MRRRRHPLLEQRPPIIRQRTMVLARIRRASCLAGPCLSTRAALSCGRNSGERTHANGSIAREDPREPASERSARRDTDVGRLRLGDRRVHRCDLRRGLNPRVDRAAARLHNAWRGRRHRRHVGHDGHCGHDAHAGHGDWGARLRPHLRNLGNRPRHRQHQRRRHEERGDHRRDGLSGEITFLCLRQPHRRGCPRSRRCRWVHAGEGSKDRALSSQGANRRVSISSRAICGYVAKIRRNPPAVAFPLGAAEGVTRFTDLHSASAGITLLRALMESQAGRFAFCRGKR
jgi:hypothetical protein